jgi:hypothetical protein
MLSMSISNVVYYAVKQEITEKRSGRDNQAMYFNFDLGMSYNINDFSYDTRRGLHLLYQWPAEYSSVNVFSGVTSSPFARIGEVDFKFETCHDSCWRNLNIFSTIYFDMSREINEEYKKDFPKRKSIAPIKMNEYNHCNKNLYSWVNVKVSKDPTCDRNWRKLVKIL